MRLYAKLYYRQTLKNPKYWNFKLHVVIGKLTSPMKPFDQFYCTIKSWKQCAHRLQIAVVVLLGDVYVKRLAAFEKLLDEGSEI